MLRTRILSAVKNTKNLPWVRRIVAPAGSAGGAVCKSVGTRGNTNPRPGSSPLCYWTPRQ